MNKNEITIREVENDGKSIFLYYDDMVGLYLAYGLSAYYTTRVTDPYISYSDEMQMPVALLRKEHVLILKQSLKLIEHQNQSYYRFEFVQILSEDGYSNWAQQVR